MGNIVKNKKKKKSTVFEGKIEKKRFLIEK
jgi:hypothetical protein